MTYVDKTLTCRDCGREFTFTQGEQEFYAQKGFQNQPTRCPECRQAAKQARGDRGGYSSGGYSSRPERQMYDVTCDSCGKQTQVPFQPRGDRPVYCSDCYQRNRMVGSR